MDSAKEKGLILAQTYPVDGELVLQKGIQNVN
jgi:hypothetical protein